MKTYTRTAWEDASYSTGRRVIFHATPRRAVTWPDGARTHNAPRATWTRISTETDKDIGTPPSPPPPAGAAALVAAAPPHPPPLTPSVILSRKLSQLPVYPNPGPIATHTDTGATEARQRPLGRGRTSPAGGGCHRRGGGEERRGEWSGWDGRRGEEGGQDTKEDRARKRYISHEDKSGRRMGADGGQ